MQAFLCKIKPGKKETWINWCHLLDTDYRAEALETLKEEHLSYEACAIFSIEGEDYIIGFDQGEVTPANMDRPLNKKHREMRKECLEKIGPAQFLYELRG